MKDLGSGGFSPCLCVPLGDSFAIVRVRVRVRVRLCIGFFVSSESRLPCNDNVAPGRPLLVEEQPDDSEDSDE